VSVRALYFVRAYCYVRVRETPIFFSSLFCLDCVCVRECVRETSFELEQGGALSA